MLYYDRSPCGEIPQEQEAWVDSLMTMYIECHYTLVDDIALGRYGRSRDMDKGIVACK